MPTSDIAHLITRELERARHRPGFDDIAMVGDIAGGVELLVLSPASAGPDGRFDGILTVLAAYDATLVDNEDESDAPGYGLSHLRLHVTGRQDGGSFALEAAKLIGTTEEPGPGKCKTCVPDLAEALAGRGYATGMDDPD